MTHPLISAFAHLAKIETSLAKVTIDEHREQLLVAYQRNGTLVDELVACTPHVDFSVGFFCGANNRPMIVWLWPLKSRFVAEIEYWLDNSRYEYDFDRHPKIKAFRSTRFYHETIEDCNR